MGRRKYPIDGHTQRQPCDVCEKVLQWREDPSTMDARHLDTHEAFHVTQVGLEVAK